MIEQTREIVRRFTYIYGDTLVEPEMLLPDNAACLRLPGTDGKATVSYTHLDVYKRQFIYDTGISQ